MKKTETIRMDLLIRVFVQALDAVEIAYLGASTNHGKRIAVLCAAMGRYLGLDEEEISNLVTCALLHDSALTEYLLLLQQGQRESSINLGVHCELGQRNAETLPFKKTVEGFVLYHHERADGLGPFGKTEGQFPLEAELIAAADMLDVERHFQRVRAQELPSLREKICGEIHSRFTKRAGNALLAVLDGALLTSLRDDTVNATAGQTVPVWLMDMDDPALVPIAELIAHIIDFKSAFTRVHTTQIANRAWLMAEHYGYDPVQKHQLYLAAALHDLGKLFIPSEILEKPGKLDSGEFEVIKTHIAHTRKLLGDGTGLGQITEWAANHHEKLDGTGYPLGKTAAELDFNSRLMACIDIYQAVSEERPYHPRRSHAETMPVLYDMAGRGFIDPGIVKDMDTVMEAWSNKDPPFPSV
jgi:HD-GYP domain-containing protein (c-di-GMP phosphodiesterase class II)